MSSAAKSKARPAVVPVVDGPVETPRTPPATIQDAVDRIRALGVLVGGHVQFMAAVAEMPSSSSEAKRRAAMHFWERLRGLEKELSQIREELFLG